MEITQEHKESFKLGDDSLTKPEEENIYKAFEYVRKLLKNKKFNKIDFFQLWQQKNFISELERSIYTDPKKNYFLEEDPKDKKNKKCHFFLPNINKIISIDYYKGTRRLPGWVRYSEQEF